MIRRHCEESRGFCFPQGMIVSCNKTVYLHGQNRMLQVAQQSEAQAYSVISMSLREERVTNRPANCSLVTSSGALGEIALIGARIPRPMYVNAVFRFQPSGRSSNMVVY